ncbi:MAG: threonine synthase [candidate division KSB1 bacterium]|nr:threonine synthase [candidate division KSB1 bacterium]MDZ7304142.1 threonine synthase [candidate division KSB1 bacterium]MDZ7314098.1 threonine synthase [candidate division KSB1 bacterium]
MSTVIALRCVVCGKTPGTQVLYTCPACGPEGILDVLYDYEQVQRTFRPETLASRPQDIRRYEELLPIVGTLQLPPTQIGWTPIFEATKLAAFCGIARLYIKDDSRNPTASFKDRASAIGVAKALELGFTDIACASTGNAASSLAGAAAAVGLRSTIFVPESAPEPKVAQLLIFGARVIRIRKPATGITAYEAAYDLCMQACERYGWYNRNCAINPYLVEGKKTAGLEIAEQMRESMPDWVVVSVGDGCTIAGVGKGLAEMQGLGWIARQPRLLGVQAEGAAPIAKTFFEGGELIPARGESVAESIAVSKPRNWRKAIRAIRNSQGTMITVSDEAILQAQQMTARLAGVFGEPAAVAGIAGLKKAVASGIVPDSAAVLVVITGSGLKDIQAVRRTIMMPEPIEADMDKLDRYLKL